MHAYLFTSHLNGVKQEVLGAFAASDDFAAIEFGKGMVRDVLRSNPKTPGGWTLNITLGANAICGLPYEVTAAAI